MSPGAETCKQAGSGKVGAKEVWEMGTTLLSPAQGMPLIFVP